MIEQIEKILEMVEMELKNVNSKWTIEQLLKVVKPEMQELYKHFNRGDLYFRYGRAQRMLESTYIITDSMNGLNNTSLGKEIIKLQNIYNCL